MNRFDRLQIVPTSGGDISGTIVEADKKVAVWGGSECENVPSGVTFCDHLEEQTLPLNYWGQYYVGAHAPIRGNENFHWRVYAGKDLTTISTTPAQPGFPVTLDKGEFITLVTTEDVIFSGDASLFFERHAASVHADLISEFQPWKTDCDAALTDELTGAERAGWGGTATVGAFLNVPKHVMALRESVDLVYE